MNIEAMFDGRTSTITYVVWDPDTRDAVVIDPVMDFDPLVPRVMRDSLDRVLQFVRAHGLTVQLALDTHVHADHLSASQRLRDEVGAKIGIGARVVEVQARAAQLFGWDTVPTDGSQWDVLAEDGVPLRAGSLVVYPLATPGHTPESCCYLLGDALFTGDTLFLPDCGTGRCDFPGGSPGDLFDSVQRLYRLPDRTRVFAGHDAQPDGREVRCQTSIRESKRYNVHLTAGTERDAFIRFRRERDRTLRPLHLLFYSLQVNANGGRLPAPDDHGRAYLRLPIGGRAEAGA